MTKIRRTTLRDVAKASGVSEMTVSRVLRGKGVVSLRTQENVRRVVDQLGYVQNRLAGSLAENRSNQVAVIIPSLTNNVFTEVMAGITSELERMDYHAVVGVTDYDLAKEQAFVESMMSWRPAAIMLSNTVHTERTTNILRHAAIPVVEMMSLSPDPIDINIGIDQRRAARELAEYVISRGHRRFAFLGWNEKDIASLERFREIEQVIRAHELSVLSPRLYDSPPNFLRGKADLAEILRDDTKPDAVFFPNDTTAIGGMVHCIEVGMGIPDDIALAGYSGLSMGQGMPFQLTTIETKRFETGQRAAANVLRRLNNCPVKPILDMGYRLIPGGRSSGSSKPGLSTISAFAEEAI